MKVIELLTDINHWVGWMITTLALVGLLAFLPSSFNNDILLIPLSILIVVAIVDIIKHKIGLQ